MNRLSVYCLLLVYLSSLNDIHIYVYTKRSIVSTYCCNLIILLYNIFYEYFKKTRLCPFSVPSSLPLGLPVARQYLGNCYGKAPDYELHNFFYPLHLRQPILLRSLSHHLRLIFYRILIHSLQLTNLNYPHSWRVLPFSFSNALIGNILSGNYSAAQNQMQASAFQLTMFVGPFIVGLILLLALSPFILCCCACPDSCPVRCCRKN
jgi:hypothetical protein